MARHHFRDYCSGRGNLLPARLDKPSMDPLASRGSVGVSVVGGPFGTLPVLLLSSSPLATRTSGDADSSGDLHFTSWSKKTFWCRPLCPRRRLQKNCLPGYWHLHLSLMASSCCFWWQNEFILWLGQLCFYVPACGWIVKVLKRTINYNIIRIVYVKPFHLAFFLILLPQ